MPISLVPTIRICRKFLPPNLIQLNPHLSTRRLETTIPVTTAQKTTRKRGVIISIPNTLAEIRIATVPKEVALKRSKASPFRLEMRLDR